MSNVDVEKLHNHFLTTIEAANYLRLSPRTLEKMRVTGEGPQFRKLGRRVLYTKGDLDAWAEAQTRKSTSDPGMPPLSC
ncbi:MAG: helix-turn-helix domain-containing protein [Sphingomonadales bacterium]|nr:helix-turn-helix domain-containing protein [Sphingomonadales bacterium]